MKLTMMSKKKCEDLEILLKKVCLFWRCWVIFMSARAIVSLSFLSHYRDHPETVMWTSRDRHMTIPIDYIWGMVTVMKQKRKAYCTVLLSILIPHRDHPVTIQWPFLIYNQWGMFTVWSRWGNKIERSNVYETITKQYENGDHRFRTVHHRFEQFGIVYYLFKTN